MCSQIKCSIYLVQKGNFGLLRKKKFFPGYLGVRPSHLIVVDWPSRKTYKALPYDDILQWVIRIEQLFSIRAGQWEVIVNYMSKSNRDKQSSSKWEKMAWSKLTTC